MKVILILAIFYLSGCSFVYGPITSGTITSRITHKERVVKGHDSYYLIHTENEVLKNEDSWYGFKFNSSDLYGKFVIGKECKLKVIGWRVPFLSMYRNIIQSNCEGE